MRKHVICRDPALAFGSAQWTRPQGWRRSAAEACTDVQRGGQHRTHRSVPLFFVFLGEGEEAVGGWWHTWIWVRGPWAVGIKLMARVPPSRAPRNYASHRLHPHTYTLPVIHMEHVLLPDLPSDVWRLVLAHTITWSSHVTELLQNTHTILSMWSSQNGVLHCYRRTEGLVACVRSLCDVHPLTHRRPFLELVYLPGAMSRVSRQWNACVADVRAEHERTVIAPQAQTLFRAVDKGLQLGLQAPERRDRSVAAHILALQTCLLDGLGAHLRTLEAVLEEEGAPPPIRRQPAQRLDE